MNLQAFKSYLKSGHYSSRTISEHCKNTCLFMDWLGTANTTEIEQITTGLILEYVSHLKKKSLATSTINVRLGSLRKYFDYLVSENRIEKNPADKLYIKGEVKKVVVDPLDGKELEQLYKAYLAYLDDKPIRESKQHKTILRKKVVLSLLIFQGLHTGQLSKLEVNHINQLEGSIYIPSTTKSMSRELKIAPLQFALLITYLNSLEEGQTCLLDFGVRNQMAVIMEELRGLNERVQNAIHLRSCVIFHWLKTHNKRQVQYLIGHKWISSTEHYEVQDLESLTDQLEKYHPLS